MNKFNKLYENIFKAASTEEVRERKEQGDLEEFKEKIEEDFGIKYEDLLKKENINKQNRWGSTPLMLASRYNIEIVKLLLNSGADVNICNKDYNTALIWASNEGHQEIVKLLIDSGAIVDFTNKFGNTALMFASMNGYKEIIKLLIKAGADVNVENSYGRTPFIYAKYFNNEEVIDLFKQYGAKE